MHQPKYTLPPSPHPGICGALLPYWQLFGSPVCGDSLILSLLSWGMWGISRGFVLIQDGGDCSCKDFWVHFGTLKWTQVFTGICEIRFIVFQINRCTSINLEHGFKKANYALILRCQWLFVSLLHKVKLSECCLYTCNLWERFGDSSSPVLVKNFLFLENISSLPFSLREHSFFRRGVGRRNPYEHECKISQPSLYIFC